VRGIARAQLRRSGQRWPHGLGPARPGRIPSSLLWAIQGWWVARRGSYQVPPAG
jgi:hypothetical protein